jgi:transposase
MKRPRRNHAPGFKAKVALAALKGDKTLPELSQQFDVHPNQVTQWKAHLLERAAELFSAPSDRTPRPMSRPSTRRSASWPRFGRGTQQGDRQLDLPRVSSKVWRNTFGRWRESGST